VDNNDTLYATDSDGNIIWVFDSSGAPKGTLQPAKAPPLPTPGPGIIPAGFEAELNLPGTGLFGTPTPVGGAGSLTPRFEFCGIATDPRGNLYTIDLISPKGLSILRFDHDGNVTARWPVPKGYEPTSGCVAADAEHLFLSARTGSIYVLDYNAQLQREIKLQFQPFGISPGGKGNLIVMGPNVLKRVDINTSQVISMTMPPSRPELQIPMLYTQNGELIVSDHVNTKLIRVNPENGKILGEIGGAGPWPGQIGAIGGLIQDHEGRIYVADYVHRVIQRFTPDGKIDAVWWAARLSSEQGESER
jgi:DNA-binding beta-propeller fold protein YncE